MPQTIRKGTLLLCLLFALAVTLTGCGGGSAVAPLGPRHTTSKLPRNSSSYTVHKGDTLYSIAWRFRVDYRSLAAVNHIRSPFTIYPGQVLKISGVAGQKAYSPPPKPKPSTAGSSHRPQPTTSNTPTAAVTTWAWPAAGAVQEGFSAAAGGNKGIDISGHRGAKISAAADGQVVYAGSGLRQYGNLIIIKHNATYLSAYAHNDSLLVNEGDRVKQGQQIARMGSSGTNQVKLHFEIRRQGNTINPLSLLPKRR
ncbi:MAG: peptidoglycan DD-metalloendopeptidase family protein [Gammaproteobacteria bacterium]|nr:peptidoglycan DD-metalloendopeptidase family protein [Gammaproteobacteria bacterium]